MVVSSSEVEGPCGPRWRQVEAQYLPQAGSVGVELMLLDPTWIVVVAAAGRPNTIALCIGVVDRHAPLPS